MQTLSRAANLIDSLESAVSGFSVAVKTPGLDVSAIVLTALIATGTYGR